MFSGLLEEPVVEGVTTAEEVDRNPTSHDLLQTRFPNLGLMPHENLKRTGAEERFVVHTGEGAPYSGVR